MATLWKYLSLMSIIYISGKYDVEAERRVLKEKNDVC